MITLGSFPSRYATPARKRSYGYIGMDQLEVFANVDAVTPVFPVLKQGAKYRLCLHDGTADVCFKNEADLSVF